MFEVFMGTETLPFVGDEVYSLELYRVNIKRIIWLKPRGEYTYMGSFEDENLKFGEKITLTEIKLTGGASLFVYEKQENEG